MDIFYYSKADNFFECSSLQAKFIRNFSATLLCIITNQSKQKL